MLIRVRERHEHGQAIKWTVEWLSKKNDLEMFRLYGHTLEERKDESDLEHTCLCLTRS